jgi:hypothetical protein
MFQMCRFATLYILCTLSTLLAAACSRQHDDASAQESANASANGRRPVVEASEVPYHAIAFADTGSVTGHVVFTGVPKGDTLITVPAEQNGCGKPLTIDRLDRTKDGYVADAVVWLTDVRAGRALPLDRRFEVENADCEWHPHVQAIVLGGTVNVSNDDPLVDRAYITRFATGDTMGIAPFTDAGQVIPYDHVFHTPGIRELFMESRPMSHAWVVVLDHPFFDVTRNDGTFTISGVPAGTHAVRVWHPLLGVADGTVQVTQGKATTLTLQFH